MNSHPNAGNFSQLVFDTDGHLLTQNGSAIQACEIDPGQGITNCTTVLPQGLGGRSCLAAFGNGLFCADGSFLAFGTGQILGQIGSGWTGAFYLPATNRIFAGFLANAAGSYSVIDAGAYQILTNLQNEIPISSVVNALAPDWVAIQTNKGFLIGEVPQLSAAPAFSAQDVVNAASGSQAVLAPGEIISIYGASLGPAAGNGPIADDGLQLATTVADTQVIFNGVPGAILYTGSNLINVVVPETVTGDDSVTMQVTRYGVPSQRITVPATSYQPGMFAYALQGKYYAAALNSAGSLQGPANPLTRGSLAVFYATGLGLPTGVTAESVHARADALPLNPTVTIGGESANVIYAGAAPGETAGLTQINVEIPSDAHVGSAIEVVVSIGGVSAGNVWVAIQ